MSAFSDIEHTFIDTLGLLIIDGHFAAENGKGNQYRTGWLDGYMEAWVQVTGKSKSQLQLAANISAVGSGNELARFS